MSRRNRKIEQCVLNFYDTLPLNLRQFTFDIKKSIATLKNCIIVTYQEFAELNDVGINEVINYCESKTGCVKKEQHKNKHIILFNDSPYMTEESKAFTLSHELGHILLGHMVILENFNLYNSNYSNEHFQREANQFAACLLCPMPVLTKINPKSPLSIKENFGLSEQSAEIVFNDYQHYDKYYNIAWHNDMLKLFDFQFDLRENDFPPGISVSKGYRSNLWAGKITPREAEITISPNMQERYMFDWI